MLFSFNWLRELVLPKPKDPHKVAQVLRSIGHEVEGMKAVDDDWAIDLAINPNRGDCLSHWGMARELAAGLHLELQLPKTTLDRSKQARVEPIPVKIDAVEHCHRYIATVGELTATVGDSPEFIQKRLTVCGIRPINSLVDIANYVMLETGQPLHVFDLDEITGSIIVRLGKSGEKLLALDGKEYEINDGVLLIADEQKPLAIAGVIGGEESAVSSVTKKILLECAYFVPTSIRKTSKQLGITTESSYRFERDIDQESMMGATNRAIQLFTSYASLLPASEAVDVVERTPQPIQLIFRLDYGERLLGLKLDLGTVNEVLTSLGLGIVAQGERTVTVDIPSWRKDLLLEADLAEEVARIIGYDEIPTNPVTCRIPTRVHNNAWLRSHQLAEVLCGLGFYEACLPSITSSSFIKKLYGEKLQEWCSDLAILSQPLSAEMDCLTPSQLPTMLSILINNVKMGNSSAAFWSSGYVFCKRYRDYISKPVVTIGIYGNLASRNWQQAEPAANIFLLKGVLEVVWNRLHLEGNFILLPVQHPIFDPGFSAVIQWGDATVGVVGELNKNLAKEYRFSQTPVLLEMDLTRFQDSPSTQPLVVVPSHMPVIKRDLSLIVPQDLPIGKVLERINKISGDLAESIDLLDLYKGKNVPTGKLSFLVSIGFRHPERTLTDDEITSLVNKIIAELASKFGVELRV